MALLGCLAFSAYVLWRTEQVHAAEQTAREKTEKLLGTILNEVTRLRIEQSAEGQGPAALLERLRVYAPLLADARTTEPDFQNAKKELQAIVRAFESCGREAWPPIIKRLEEADPRQDFDEIKYLLEILIRLDPGAGKQITKEVLQGHRLPLPRLRWWAADLLISHDKPLAAMLLRKILMTESSRGIDINRAMSVGLKIPDPAALSATGFNNYVQRYLRTEDPKTEETLLMLITRVEHDAITIQDCIKELGRRKSTRALPTIEKIYDNPPNKQQNPLFLVICIRAIEAIAGKDAIDWFEEKLKTAPTDIVANALQAAIDKHR